ncbi:MULTISPECIES: DUF2281 domain-containing protein [Cyanophyceae]|uniref:DUF2281 domain-containing protein n=1 Tax=Cyanophyceae TaxID=3028117 RepID=UPI00168270C5|nr:MULTISPECIES: DUF2281 domain-containing protein [Cyanophyceae]MBD1917982.1 DUF2281 domain-containing protein [Phormidium sp. FACHB-77]MBD2029230.1 DUF2281 domain-containing protein [Phormidium sp. FACHB-322]MBD2049762.1 DUF2281 domain-containing protein [Leptolyngbya sp. FACHB-60]
MNIEQALLEQVRSLTPAQQQAVLDFAAFLRQKVPVALKEPIPGLHKDIPYRMADDFDAPLPDEFWLGES